MPAHDPVTRALPLDGVRGLAIALVLAHHAIDFAPGIPTLPLVGPLVELSWVGVDLFFVLSGFLITRLLVADVATPRGLRRFVVRRAFRLLPPYGALLAALAALHGLLGHDRIPEATPLVERPQWYVLYAVNLLIAREGWDAAGHALDMLWSLAVEEQFYLVWPLVVLAAGPHLPRVAVACMVAAPVLRLLLLVVGVGPDAGFVLMPTRADALAMGAVLALFPAERLRIVMPIAASLAAASVAGIVVVEGTTPWGPGMRVIGYGFVAIACAGLVHAAATAAPGGVAVRMLSWRPLVRLGTWSYVIYLVHQPIATRFMRIALPDALARAGVPAIVAPTVATMAYLALSIGIAAASWRWYERPLQRLRDRALACAWFTRTPVPDRADRELTVGDGEAQLAPAPAPRPSVRA